MIFCNLKRDFKSKMKIPTFGDSKKLTQIKRKNKYWTLKGVVSHIKFTT